ncbi:hypothetical protein AC579_3606 [Pseudocercospora musae]|uniref:Uncharacterized protein n=1 Tax=Pseudocercospora musae TaxID=113226 RepID=A0A139ISX7_9PEZI|nr:hypothetical protein AC579_3606 [Pseudocercospora musae]
MEAIRPEGGLRDEVNRCIFGTTWMAYREHKDARRRVNAGIAWSDDHSNIAGYEKKLKDEAAAKTASEETPDQNKLPKEEAPKNLKVSESALLRAETRNLTPLDLWHKTYTAEEESKRTEYILRLEAAGQKARKERQGYLYGYEDARYQAQGVSSGRRIETTARVSADLR